MITNNDIYRYRAVVQQLHGIKNWEIESRLIIFASNVNDNRISGYSIDASRHVVSIVVRNVADSVSVINDVGDIIRNYVNESKAYLSSLFPQDINTNAFFEEFLSNNNLIADISLVGTRVTIGL